MVASVAGTVDTLDSPEDCHTRSKDLLDSFMVWSLTFDGDQKKRPWKKGGDDDQLSDVGKVSAADWIMSYIYVHIHTYIYIYVLYLHVDMIQYYNWIVLCIQLMHRCGRQKTPGPSSAHLRQRLVRTAKSICVELGSKPFDKMGIFHGFYVFNGRSPGSNWWRYVSTIFQAIFCGDIPLHRPDIGLIYGRYLQSRILKWPLMLRD